MALSKLARRRLQALLIPLGCAYLGFKMLKPKFEGIAPVGAVLILGVGILVAIYIYPSKESDLRRATRRNARSAGRIKTIAVRPVQRRPAGLLRRRVAADNATMSELFIFLDRARCPDAAEYDGGMDSR